MVDLVEWKKDRDVIGHLERLLADARVGEVTGILVAAHYTDNEIAYIGSGSLCSCPLVGVAATQQLAKKLLE